MEKGGKELGKKGEQMARRYLKKHKYRVIAKNYFCRFGEIDIVAEKDGELYFIEVKTRRSLLYGTPAESVTREKQKRMYRAAVTYMQRENKFCAGFHIDVIEMMEKEGKFYARHLKDAIEM